MGFHRNNGQKSKFIMLKLKLIKNYMNINGSGNQIFY